jgi:ribonuclease T2
MRILASLLLFVFMATSSSQANECVMPGVDTLAASYDWNRYRERSTCLRQITNIPAEYYMLTLSYSPRFCKEQAASSPNGAIKAQYAFQCGKENTFGWIVHGLWAQSFRPKQCQDSGKTVEMHPRYCGGDRIGQVDPAVIRKYMCMQPSEFLLQGEWEKHGTCGPFNTAEEYFAKTRQLFEALTLPKEDLRPPKLFQVLKHDNPQLKNIRIGYESGEIRVCYNTNWQHTDCP